MWWVGLLAAPLSAQTVPAIDVSAVRAVLIARINDGTFRGIATSWRESDTLRVVAAGATQAGGVPIEADTRFPLGEAGTSLLTSALLANLVTRGEVSLDDPVQPFLPASVRLPVRDGRPITLGDLAFHRAGLPDLPLGPGASATERIARALRGRSLLSAPGSEYAYSQIGVEILGVALGRHLRLPLSAAIRARILSPLRLSDIVVMLDSDARSLDAVGHTLANGTMLPVRRAVGGGAWAGSAESVGQLLAAATDTVSGPLASTFALMLRSRSAGPDAESPVALGWRVLRLDGRDLFWQDSQNVPGFSVYLAVDPDRHRTAAVLSNTARELGAIAGQLLLGSLPVIQAAPSRDDAPPPPLPRRRRPQSP